MLRLLRGRRHPDTVRPAGLHERLYRPASELTEKLIAEGAAIHYEENVSAIPEDFLDPETTLIVYTPAIPATHKEFVYFQEKGFNIQKRAQVLGMLTRTERGLCVAGTHG